MSLSGRVFLLSFLPLALAMAGEPQPFNSAPLAIPGTLEAEHFDKGGDGVAFYKPKASKKVPAFRPEEGLDTEPCTDGPSGFSLSYCQPAQWVAYTVDIKRAGVYKIGIRSGVPGDQYALVHLEFKGKDKTGFIPIQGTGDWKNYVTVVAHAKLDAGVQVMKLHFDKANASGRVPNINWLEFTEVPQELTANTLYLENLRRAFGLAVAKQANECKDLLEICREEAQGNSARMTALLKMRAEIGQMAGNMDSAIADYTAALGMSSDADFPDILAGALRLHSRSKGHAAAAFFCESLAAENAGRAMRLAPLLEYLSWCYMERLDRLENAVTVCRRIVAECASQEATVRTAQARLVESLCRMKDFDTAIKEQDALVASAVGKDGRRSALLHLGEVQQRASRFEDARRTYSIALKEAENDENRAICTRRLAAAFEKEGKQAEAVKHYTQILHQYPLQFHAVQQSMKALSSYYTQQSDTKNALKWAVRLYCAAQDTAEVQEANKTIAEALRRTDGSLSRANAFLRFQSSGPRGADGLPGTADDMSNPLDAYFKEGILPDADEKKLLESAAGNKEHSVRAQCYVQLYFGETGKALSGFKKLHVECGLHDSRFQQTIDDIVVALKGVKGNVFAGSEFVEFLMHGPTGKSGKESLSNVLNEF